MDNKDHIIWYQGMAPIEIPKCDGRIPETLPASRRIADEYRGGYFNLSRAINQNPQWGDDWGAEVPLKKQLEEVQEGETLWCVLIPPEHRVLDVWARNAPVHGAPDFSYTTMAGYSFTVMTAEFKRDPSLGYALCEQNFKRTQDKEVLEKHNEEEHFSLVLKEEGPSFGVKDFPNRINNTETYLAVGLRVDQMPEDRKLSDIIGIILVGAHCYGFDSPIFN